MENDNKSKRKFSFGGNSNGSKNSFNFYWLYAIIGVVLISFSLFNNVGGSAPIYENDLEEYVENNEVREIVIVNKRIAQIYLTDEAMTKEPHKSKIKTPVLPSSKNNQFQYTMEIGFEDVFGKKLEQWKVEKGIKYRFTTEEDWLGGILSFALPLLIFVGIWLFIMRRMSGGAGGAGGQIFNIGKSKATLFDKEKSIKITFEDVAGLEGAK